MISMVAIICCSLGNCKEPQKNINEEIKSMGLTQFFVNGDTPIKIIELDANESKLIALRREVNPIYGVLVVNGFELSKRYKSKVVSLMNADNATERFSTGHSAFRQFSQKDDGLQLRVKNDCGEKIKVILYIKGSS